MYARRDAVAGRYRLDDVLGHGGMGTVWRARDLLLGRDVAVKQVTVPPGAGELDRAELFAMARAEARAAAAVSHPNIVRVYDLVEDDGPWLVMPCLAGRTLRDAYMTAGPLAPARVMRIGLDLLAAVGCLHAAGILHRDINPRNVLLTDDGHAQLADFGLAVFTGDDEPELDVRGTPGFIAPERALWGTSGPAGDLWSLGATLYAAVEGRAPYGRATTDEIMAASIAGLPEPPRHPGALSGTIMSMLHPVPQRRPTAEVAAARLTATLVRSHLTTPVRAVVPAQRVGHRPPAPLAPPRAARVPARRPGPVRREPAGVEVASSVEVATGAIEAGRPGAGAVRRRSGR